MASSNTLLPPLRFQLHAAVFPDRLPSRQPAAIGVEVQGKVLTTDRTHPAAMREAILNFDRNVTINAMGLPVCGRAKLEAMRPTAARRVCRRSIVGSGTAHVALDSPAGTKVVTPVTLFNGGVKSGKTTLFIQGFVTSAIVAEVRIHKISSARYGWQALVKIPTMAEGKASLVDFDFTVDRRFKYRNSEKSYLTARCRDGRLQVEAPKILFRNEAHVPGTEPVAVLAGNVSAQCKPAS